MHDADGDAAMESALLVLVPEADPVVGEHRALLDLSARDGVPAHLTVLYPFLPPQRIGPEELTALTRLFAGFRDPPGRRPGGGRHRRRSTVTASLAAALPAAADGACPARQRPAHRDRYPRAPGSRKPSPPRVRAVSAAKGASPGGVMSWPKAGNLDAR